MQCVNLYIRHNFLKSKHMAFNARVFRIFIASPSDVKEERDVISRVIQEWNDLHSFDRKVVLLPLRWETHSAPELGKRPQELINLEIVDHADMAVGVFWTRIGTPTGGFDSGTIEEIDRIGKADKLVMCYFSKAKVEIDSIDLEQYAKLKEFKKKTYKNGLVEQYSNIVEFRDLFVKQLEIKIRTLIAKDGETGSQDSAPSKPRLELGIIDPISKENIGDIITINPRMLSFSKLDIEKIPDYEIEEKKKELFNRINKDFYRQYVEYIKEEWAKTPIQFSLYNPSPIAIRDIFIDIQVKKLEGFIITRKISKKPEANSAGFSIDLGENFEGLIGVNTLNVHEKEDYYQIQISYAALQPQRSIQFSYPFFIESSKKLSLELNVNIYADCFPKPFTKEMTIKIEPNKIKRTPIEILQELEILK